jgi:hypothetical protein
MFTQASFQGGISSHGISTGTSTSGTAATELYDGVVINMDRGGTQADTNWDTCLPILATSAGVYYHVPGSGYLTPLSQTMVVRRVAWDPGARIIYAATDHGVLFLDLTKQVITKTPSTWSLLGGAGSLTAPVDDIWLDGSILLARCGGLTKKNGVGIDGIYRYPALTGDTSGAKQGFAGYSRIAHSGAPLAAGGTSTNLYYVDKNKPDTVYLIQPGTTTAPKACTGILAGQTVVGIDTVGGSIYVRTTGGNAGLYTCTIGQTVLLNANADGTLKSNDGAQVQIYRIQQYGPVGGTGASFQGEQVVAFAATDAGLFRTDQVGGGAWSSPNTASGLGDFAISFIMAGTVQTVLGRALTRIFAGAKRSFLISANSGDNWKDLLADKLDLGPFWYALAGQSITGSLGGPGGPWPDSTLGALGSTSGLATNATSVGSILGATAQQASSGNLSPAGATDTGGTGTVLPVPTHNPRQLPSGWIWARRLDEQSQFTFRLVNLNSQAPYAGMQWSELSELQANADVGVITASEQIALVVWRWLYGASIPRIQLTLNSSITQTNAAARDLYPGDKVGVRYNPPGWTAVLALNTTLYVQKHTIGKASRDAAIKTTTNVSNSLEATNLDPHAAAAAEADRLTRRIRFGSG